jgi:hypothetical protein
MKYIEFTRERTLVGDKDAYIIYGLVSNGPMMSPTWRQLHVTTIKDVSEKAWQFILKNHGNGVLLDRFIP